MLLTEKGSLVLEERSTEASEIKQATPRFDTIDLLRGLSILGVVLLHISIWLTYGSIHVGESFPPWLRYVVFSQGGNGVSAFFAISGFLITFISIRRFGSLAELRAWKFYRIRFARIFPLLLSLLVVLSILHLTGVSGFRIKPDQGTILKALFAALTFHLNWFEAVHGYLPPAWTVLWSLSVEEMFYLFFPLACIVLYRRNGLRPLFFVLMCGLIVFGPFARTPWYSKNDVWLYQSYLGNLDNVAMGCLCALLATRIDLRGRFARSRWPVYLQAFGTLLTAFIVVWDWPKTLFGWRMKRAIGRSGLDVTILGAGICLIMLGSVLRNTKGWRWTSPMRWLGRYSYEVYLSHVFVQMGVLNLFFAVRRGPVAVWVVATVLLETLAGYLLSRFFSEPLNRKLRGAPAPAELQPEVTTS